MLAHQVKKLAAIVKPPRPRQIDNLPSLTTCDDRCLEMHVRCDPLGAET